MFYSNHQIPVYLNSKTQFIFLFNERPDPLWLYNHEHWIINIELTVDYFDRPQPCTMTIQSLRTLLKLKVSNLIWMVLVIYYVMWHHCIISNIAINNYCRTEYLIWSFWILFVIYNVNILVHISHALSLNDITLFKVLFYISIIKKQEERRFFRVINIVLSCLRTNIWIPVLI